MHCTKHLSNDRQFSAGGDVIMESCPRHDGIRDKIDNTTHNILDINQQQIHHYSIYS